MDSQKSAETVLRAVLVALAALGLINALYFTLLYFRLIPPDSRFLPAFCRLGEQTCQAVVFTAYGRFWRVPNGLIGTLFYLLVIAAAVFDREWLLEAALAAALLSLVYGAYLIHALAVRLRVRCPL
ncbi:MAG TPA: vitamin K epoxide reductase family protein [Chthonomonadales bacterium]|nr:vitamin K epoxide reductase family protein [Chthonomonadales bacterium]